MLFWNKHEEKEGQVAVAKPQKRKTSLKKKVMLCLLLAVLAAASVLCWRLVFVQEEREVRTGETTFGSLTASIEGTGTTLPQDSVTYSTGSTGEILEVCVAAGDEVAVGDLLYRQDDSEIDEEVDEYQDEIGQNQDNLADYDTQRKNLLEEIANLRVTAPFRGRLQSVQVEQGDTVRVGDALAILVDDTTMTLTQYFSYSYEQEITLGMAATVSVPDLMQSFSGTVTDIRKVERVTAEGVRTFAVTVSIDNPGALTENMTAGGYLTTAGGEKRYPSVEGKLSYAATETITALAEGKILQCNGVDYQMVEQGSVLFLLDGTSYETQRKNLDSQIARANDRIATLTQRIADSEEKRANFEVRSELAGTVIFCNVRVGDTPQVGRTAVMVYNLDAMSIQVNIDELDIEYVTKGMEVTITRAGAEGSQDYVGTVTEISLEATDSNGVSTFPVTIHIPSGGVLSAGVSVSYRIQTGDTEEGVLAPVNAVQYTDEGTCLFVRGDSPPEGAVELDDVDIPAGFYAVPVEVGTSNAQHIRILSGVEEGATLFLGYKQSAPGNSSSTSQGDETESAVPGGSIQMMPSGGMTMPSGGGMQRPMG